MADWIGETFTSETGWDHLETLVDTENGNRMAGGEGERRAAEATRDALDAAGARNARLDEFPIQGWSRGSSAVVAGGIDHDSIALPRSPAGERTGELVDLGYGLPADFETTDVEGKVVMAASDVPDHHDRFIHRTEKYHRAVAGGAAAFVFRNHVPGQLPPTGSVSGADGPLGEIPAVGVSKEVGSRLGRRFDDEAQRASDRSSGRSPRDGESVTVRVDAETGDATSRNVHAELGPESEKRVLVTSHVDAHDIAEGAGDNGAGTAMVVELARALAGREDELDSSVEFVAFGAEEVGLRGSEYMAENADLDGIAAILNLDGIVDGRTLSFLTHGFDELGAAAEEVGERFDHPVKIVPKQGPHSDHWPFVRWGVPGYHVSSDTGPDRGWGHTEADTLDKLDSRTFREQAVLLTELTVDLADEGFEASRKDPEEIAAALEAEDEAPGMKVTGDWPY